MSTESQRPDPDRVLAALGVRTGMTDGRYFVGRRLELSDLEGCCTGSQRSCGWIYGSRRIGKSSLARVVERKAARDGVAIWVDAIDLDSLGFDDLVERIVRNASRHEIVVKAGDTRTRLESLGDASRERPICVIIDEFDRVAVGLQTWEQACFRRLSETNPGLSFLFISGLPPSQLVEAIPDVQSQLLSICKPVRVRPLKQRAVFELCQRVAEDLDRPKIGELGAAIWSAYGGFSMAVMAAVNKLATHSYHGSELDEYLAQSLIEEDTFTEVEVPYRRYWETLQPGTRSVLLNECELDEHERDVREDGYLVKRRLFRPSMLVSVGRRWRERGFSESASEDLGLLARGATLMNLVGEINHCVRARGYPKAFEVNPLLHRLARVPCTRDAFGVTIDYAYKAFFEGAKQTKGSRQSGGKVKPPRLPPPVGDAYFKSPTIGDISNLRNYFFHSRDRESDLEKPNKYYTKALKIFRRHGLDCEPDTSEQWERLRGALLRGIHGLLETTLEQVRELEPNSSALS